MGTRDAYRDPRRPKTLEPRVPGDDRPALPGVPIRLPTPPPQIPSLPEGPWDVRAPLPWDAHVYPEIPAVEVPPEYEASFKVARWLEKKLKGEDRKRLPPRRERDTRPALPGKPPRELPPVVDRPALPAYFPEEAPAEVAAIGMTALEMMSDPQAAGLLGPTPLELYDAYLQSAGIRYFSAKELTPHKWRHTQQVVRDASVWHFMYDFFAPEIVPKGVHWLLARHVVPPPSQWPRILPALYVLDRFRHWLGEPVIGISGYRHGWYNDQIDGSSTSFHMSNSAIDFTYRRRKGGYLDHGIFLGWFDRLYRREGDGTGRYHSFIHLDVGHDRHRLPGKTERWVRPRGWVPPR